MEKINESKLIQKPVSVECETDDFFEETRNMSKEEFSEAFERRAKGYAGFASGISVWQLIKMLFTRKSPFPIVPKYIVLYKDRSKNGAINSFICENVKCLDSCISGVEMEGDHVECVLNSNYDKVEPEEIGSHQLW